MARRKRKKIVEQKWISIYFDNCPQCCADAEIKTFCRKDDTFFNMDEARCSAQCGSTGVFRIKPGQFSGEIEWRE